jgi:hypothetical protein
METAVSAPNPMCGRRRAIQRCKTLPIPLTSSSFVLSAGAGAPRDFMAPNTCDEPSPTCGEALKPNVGFAT